MQPSREKNISAESGSAPGLADRLFDLLKAVLMPTDDVRFQLVEDNDLTFGQAKALILLARSDEPISGGAVAESVGASAPVASRSLDSLVQKGFADRTECTEDRRVRLFTATESGVELAGELAALRRAQVEAFVAELPADLAERFESLLSDLEAAGAIAGASCEERP